MFKRQSSKIKDVFYVTTPIYYVNASPHIGHLYSSVIADAVQRWQQMFRPSCKIKFSTGTDEHGTKIQQAAAKSNKSLPEYCTDVSQKYRNLAKLFSIDHTDFIRTTEERHHRAVKAFWEVVRKNGHIYPKKYSGWYCVSDESFLTQTQLKEIDGGQGGKPKLVSAESGHPVEWVEEQNYMFRLSSFRDDLIHWLKQNEHSVRPKHFYDILLDSICQGPLPDVSISRPVERVHWGIRVPDDDTQTVYVWMDALVNYLTVAGYPDAGFTTKWPPDVQVIGKDILKFHGIYWPAFLMAAGMEPPRTLVCHSHWTVDGEKMSKSRNNVVCPINRSQLFTTDGLRYFLLREGVAHSDGNYSDTKAIRILNSELADTLGNLLSRCTATVLNPDQVFPGIGPTALRDVASLDVTKKLMDSVSELPDVCERHYNDYNFYKVVDAVIATLHKCNLFFETLKPWELKKNPDHEELNTVLHLTIETLRVCGILLQPVIPNICENLLNKLGVPKNARTFDYSKKLSWAAADFKPVHLPVEKVVLFRRIFTERTKKREVKSA